MLEICDIGMFKFVMELGLKVLCMMFNICNWRRCEMVQWLIECVVEVGMFVFSFVMKNWSMLFMLIEVIFLVAIIVMVFVIVLCFEFLVIEREVFLCCVRVFVLQCVSWDLQWCLFFMLIFCEKNFVVFEVVYCLVVELVVVIFLIQFFVIVCYMDYCGYFQRVFKFVILVMKYFILVYN